MLGRAVPISLVALAGLVGVACQPPKSPPKTPPGDVQAKTFTCTEGPETWTVPAGVTQVAVDIYGAQGADDAGNDIDGGRGGRTSSILAVSPAETLQVNVGCAGAVSAEGGDGGFPDGGEGDGGGGGSSDVRRGGFATSDRLLVAGGGGGTGGGGSNEGAGGHGGGSSGIAGQGSQPTCGPCTTGGDPGTQAGGGSGGDEVAPGGPGMPGQVGAGGDGGALSVMGAGSRGGGGGGGYFGGGGGGQGAAGVSAAGGGGGGSGFGPPGTAFETGVREGDGLVTIAWVA